jgi:rRNA maturation RNase YbeY
MAISFRFQQVQKPSFLKVRNLKLWLKAIAANEGFAVGELHYLFVDDEALLKVNIEYLKHDTYTDIITFDNSEDEGVIEGDIFISVERVKDNANKFKANFENELHRVIAHGLLHLCGYRDKKKRDIELMRKKEEECLRLFVSRET